MSKMITLKGVQVTVGELKRALAEAEGVSKWTGGDRFFWCDSEMVVLDDASSRAFERCTTLELPDEPCVFALDTTNGEILVFTTDELAETEKL